MDRSSDLDALSVEDEEKRQQEEKKLVRKSFLNGMLFGALTVSLILVCAYVAGKMAFDLFAVRKTGAQAAQDGSVVSTETIQKMRTIEEMVDAYYYGDEVTAGELQDGVYKGMVKALGDPYSEYFSKEELEDVVNNNQGISYGIGAMISINTNLNTAMISGGLEESPAMEAGLKEGDIIYKVGDEFTQGMSLSKVVSLVKGREGTIVNLTIYREGEPDYLEMEIVRAKQIETTTVDSGMIEGHDEIGYLRIREFEGVTPDQFTEAMAVLKENGMKGLVLDLRSNPGGDLTAVVDVARQILPAGLIVYTEDKAGNRKEYTCDGTHELQMPLVVLTNEYSASASEILAGAIKDYNKGTLIGTTTFGKGIVQRINRLKDGTAIKLTVSAYFTPSGKNIHGIGIKPDIVLEYDDEAYEADGTDNQVMKAIEVLEGKIG